MTIETTATSDPTATVDSRYRTPLQARVLDGNGQPVEGASVTFAVQPSCGRRRSDLPRRSGAGDRDDRRGRPGDVAAAARQQDRGGVQRHGDDRRRLTRGHLHARESRRRSRDDHRGRRRRRVDAGRNALSREARRHRRRQGREPRRGRDRRLLRAGPRPERPLRGPEADDEPHRARPRPTGRASPSRRRSPPERQPGGYIVTAVGEGHLEAGRVRAREPAAPVSANPSPEHRVATAAALRPRARRQRRPAHAPGPRRAVGARHRHRRRRDRRRARALRVLPGRPALRDRQARHQPAHRHQRPDPVRADGRAAARRSRDDRPHRSGHAGARDGLHERERLPQPAHPVGQHERDLRPGGEPRPARDRRHHRHAPAAT